MHEPPRLFAQSLQPPLHRMRWRGNLYFIPTFSPVFSSLFIFTLHLHSSSSLFTYHSSLFTLHFSLFTLHSSLFTLHSSLFTLHFSLFTFHSSLFTLHSSLFTFHSSLFTYHFSLFTFHFYCANEILILTPALVVVIGAEVEMYGITLR